MAPSFQDALKGAAKDALCQALNASSAFGDAIVAGWQSVTGIEAEPPNFAGIAAGLICGDPTALPPADDSGFTGGQCNCVRYSVSSTLNVTDRTADDQPRQRSLPSTIQVWGEVGSVVVRRFPAGEESTALQMVVVSRGNANLVSCGGVQDVISATAGAFRLDSATVSGVSVTRIDGQPDNCGNPTPVQRRRRPLPPEGLPPISVDFEFSPNINLPDVTVNVAGNVVLFQPRLDIDANIRVPIKIDTDINVGGVNLSVNGSINLSTGDVSFDFSGGDTTVFNPSNGCCDDFLDYGEEPPDYPDDLPPEPEESQDDSKQIIIGALVTVLEVRSKRVSQIAQGANPTIFAPSLGHVNFYCEVGVNKTGGWTEDIPVKNLRQLILCPWEEGAVTVEGTPQPGNSWVISPIYRKIRSGVPRVPSSGILQE